MLGKIGIILLFSGLYIFQGLNLFKNKSYVELGVVTLLYSVAFYYGYSDAAGLDAYNPLDTLNTLFSGISEYIFMDILGIE